MTEQEYIEAQAQWLVKQDVQHVLNYFANADKHTEAIGERLVELINAQAAGVEEQETVYCSRCGQQYNADDKTVCACDHCGDDVCDDCVAVCDICGACVCTDCICTCTCTCERLACKGCYDNDTGVCTDCWATRRRV